MRYWTFLILILPAVLASRAQTPGDCEVGSAPAYADLDVANVRARLFSNGALFGVGGEPVYEVPKGSGNNAVYTTSLWIGGRVEDELRISAATYSGWEFWPGALDENGDPPVDCTAYDRVFSVYDEDIRRYNETGDATEDMLDWPWHLGAPVFDGDGDPDNYELSAGDRPYVFGDQTLWWVMNDVGNRHLQTGTEPLGLEVRITAFAGERPRGLWTANTTFYRYELIYRGSQTLEEVYVGIFADPDLGYRGDDYIGVDSIAGIGFVYNGDDFDEGDGGYGHSLPALGYHFARLPVVDNDGRDNDLDGQVDEWGEQLRMTSFGWDTTLMSDAPRTDMAQRIYDILRGRFLATCRAPCRIDGSPYVHFMFPSMPPEYWSEEQPRPGGTPNVPGDRRFVMASGPFRMEPGDSQELVLAIIFSHLGDRHRSVAQLNGAPASLRTILPEVMTFDTTAAVARARPPESPSPVTYGLGHHPNPASHIVRFQFDLPVAMDARLVLYDLLGREIHVLSQGRFEAGREDVIVSTAGIPSGLYFYRLETTGFAASRQVIIAK